MTNDTRNPYDIDEQFRGYIEMSYYCTPEEIPVQQLREIKLAFYAAFGIALVIVNKEEPKEKDFIDMIDQVKAFTSSV